MIYTFYYSSTFDFRLILAYALYFLLYTLCFIFTSASCFVLVHPQHGPKTNNLPKTYPPTQDRLSQAGPATTRQYCQRRSHHYRTTLPRTYPPSQDCLTQDSPRCQHRKTVMPKTVSPPQYHLAKVLVSHTTK
jgi:hypothetical protein